MMIPKAPPWFLFPLARFRGSEGRPPLTSEKFQKFAKNFVRKWQKCMLVIYQKPLTPLSNFLRVRIENPHGWEIYNENSVKKPNF